MVTMTAAREETAVCQAGCGRPVDGATLCADCASDLEGALRDTPDLATALEAAFLRQQRFSVSSLAPRRPDESTVPFNAHAGRLRRELSRELLRWNMHVNDAHGMPWTPVPSGARGNTRAMAERLAQAMPYLRVNPAGAEAHRTFTRLRDRALECVDRPPDLVYLGVCSRPVDGEECPEDLYAEHGKDYARCRRCGHDHRVDERRTVLLNAVKDQLATAADIARGLSGLDMNVTAERIRQWKRRGRIEERGPSYGGDPLYRVGDVIDRLLQDAERKERKK